MKKTLIALLLISIALISPFIISPSHASTTATLGIDSSTQSFPSAKIGDTVQINLEVSNIQDLWAWDIEELTWNPSILNLTSANEGPFLQKAGQTLFIYPSSATKAFANGTIPEISDTLLEETGASGTGDIVSLTFQVVSIGTSKLSFGEVIADSPPTNFSNPDQQNSIPITAVGGTITVGTPATSSSTPTPTATATSTPTNSPNSSTGPSTDDSPSPTPTNGISNIPEFSVVSTIALLAVVAASSLVILLRKRSILQK